MSVLKTMVRNPLIFFRDALNFVESHFPFGTLAQQSERPVCTNNDSIL
jgi:hypothetical protein